MATVAVLEIVVPLVAVLSTCTMSVNVALVPLASVPIDAVKVPPTGGVNVNRGPEVCIAETNVVLAGITSDNTTLCASIGPLLVTVIV